MKIKLNYFLIVFFLWLSTLSVQAFSNDSIFIKGKLLNNTKFSKVVVQQFGVGVFDIAATAVDKETGAFTITAPKDVAPGIYRFRYSQTGYGEYVDVIINGQESQIDFFVDVTSDLEDKIPFFTESEENKDWYSFKQKFALQEKKLNTFHQFLMNYPDSKDLSYAAVYTLYKEHKKSLMSLFENYTATTPFYWSKQLAKYSIPVLTNPKDHPGIQAFSIHEHFWDAKITNDPLLINTPLYTDAILNYMSYYMNPEVGFSEEEQNTGFKKCIDQIIKLFGTNENTLEFAIKYLQLGFKELSNEKMLQYVDETYALKAQCTTSDDALQNRIKGYETLKIGNPAPEITIRLNDGSIKTLDDFMQDNIVLVFWASWCPHCMQEMPKLQEWAKNNKNRQVLAISLDDDPLAYQEVIKEFPDIIHYSDFKKWNGDIVNAYYISATPTLIYIDKNKRILNKYSSIQNFLNSN